MSPWYSSLFGFSWSEWLSSSDCLSIVICNPTKNITQCHYLMRHHLIQITLRILMREIIRKYNLNGVSLLLWKHSINRFVWITMLWNTILKTPCLKHEFTHRWTQAWRSRTLSPNRKQEYSSKKTYLHTKCKRVYRLSVKIVSPLLLTKSLTNPRYNVELIFQDLKI